MANTEAPTISAIPAIRDDTTRYLCAAVHRDAGFAELAIREFLTEPTRALPPSPGIDAPTVLREAVAARTRGLLRDWLLLAIIVLFAFLSPGLALVWVATGLALHVLGAVGRRETVAEILASLVVPVVTLVGATVLFGVWELVSEDNPGSFGSSYGSGSSLDDLPVGLGVWAVVVAVLGLAVLVLDRLAVALLETRSFQRRTFVATPTRDTWPGERWVRTMGSDNYRSDLDRVARSAVDGDLVVYRGYEPFVGAGVRLERRSYAFAIALDPSEETGRHTNGDGQARHTRPFLLRDLYADVTSKMMEMRHGPSLSPSGRLAWLSQQDQVVVPAEDVLVNHDDPAAREVLPDLSGPPPRSVPPRLLAEVVEQPREWMRFYRCFRVETWNRELAVAGYLHFGASERQLYLEWIPCVLTPVADRFRLPDSRAVRWGRLARGSVADWVRLPGDLLFRLGGMVRPIRPLPVERGYALPEKYGTTMSLREMAAGSHVQNYFQDSDAERYVELLTTRMLRAVGEFLEDEGISATEFMRQAQNIITNFNAPVNAGILNTGDHNGPTYYAPRTTPSGSSGGKP